MKSHQANLETPQAALTSHQWIHILETPAVAGQAAKFEASFRFALRGVIPPQNSPDARVEQRARSRLESITFETVLEALYPGQRLEFHLGTWRSDGTRPGLNWNIVGKTCAPTLDIARLHAERLWETLALLLASQPEYRFSPLLEPMPCTVFGWSYPIVPKHAEVTPQTGQIGFNTSEPAAPPVSLTLPVLDQPGDTHFPIILLLTSLPLDLDLCIAIEPAKVDDNTRQTLSSTAIALASNNVQAFLCPTGQEMDKASVRSQCEAWAEMLRFWAAQPEAVKTEITLRSAAPVSPGLTGTIGKALFPQYVFDAEVATHNPDPSSADAARHVDSHALHSWLPASHALLHGLFPDQAYLANLDLPRGYPRPTAHLPTEGLLLGTAEGQKIRLSQPDRFSHSYIVGATGSGKSTLLLNLVMQDIEAGRGVCLVDPHGDLYQEILERIPKRRIDEVVLFNPTDFEWAVGLNFLECTSSYPEIEQGLIANEMLGIFDQLYDMKIAGGPMFELYMRNALLLAMSGQDQAATLLDIPLIFEDAHFRRRLLARCPHPQIVSSWKNMAIRAGGEASLENVAPYIVSKLNPFTHNTLMRRIVGQRHSTLRFREIMDRGGILLVNLAKGLLSDMDTRLLGMFIMGKLFHAALSRTNTPVESRKKFYVYVDEFQNFTTPTLGQILSEARKFGLSMTLANQHLAQLHNKGDDGLMGAVLGNIGNMLLFRLGVMDAEKLEAFTKPWLQGVDLQYLPDYHVAARLLHEHQPVKPFVFKTEPPAIKPGDGHAASIIAASRSRNAVPVAEVDADINAYLQAAFEKPKVQGESKLIEELSKAICSGPEE
jgi:hypothetical protein